MLIEKTFYELMRYALAQSAMLNKHRMDIGKFEELCAVLRCQGSDFTEVLDPDEHEINYHIHPTNYGDYLAIVEATSSMGAHRQMGPSCDVVNAQPDAPAFWLHIPEVN